jgi:hypothetical protein
MNDPHVSVLIYRVRHDETVNYDKASPLEYETASFKVFVKSRRRLLARLCEAAEKSRPYLASLAVTEIDLTMACNLSTLRP